MRLVTFMSQPGRVGKATASSILAAALVARAYHTLIIDQIAHEIEGRTNKSHAEQASLNRDKKRNETTRLRPPHSSALRRSASPDFPCSSAERAAQATEESLG
jgi:dethiobiotin synthetase